MSESVIGISQDDRTKVTLGEIAKNISENEYKPKEKGLDHCVGLEHLDPGSLKIHRWSLITPEMSFTRRFYKGQILFGKRRSYQKKVALADFDGICSSDILVIEAKKENFVPELLPFILQDDRFFEYAVGTSSGSLSPRTKWKFLAEYEIWLPSLDEQCRIATMLWAAEDCIVKGERFIAAAERAKQVLMRELFSKGIGHTELNINEELGEYPNKWKITKIEDLFQVKTGTTPSTSNTIYWEKGEVVWITPTDLSKYSGEKNIDKSERKIAKIALEKNILNCVPINSIIISTRAPVGYVSINKTEACFNQGCKALVPKVSGTISPDFYYYYLTFNKSLLEQRSGGSTFQELTKNSLEKIPILYPSFAEQEQIAAILTRCDETIAAARANVGAAKALKMKMINEMLSPETR